MKVVKALAIAAGTAGLLGAGLAAPADTSFPDSRWVRTFRAEKSGPKRTYFLGQLDTIGHTGDSDAADQGIYSVWGKVRFDSAQASPWGPYTDDIYDIKLTCQTAGIQTLREIRLAADGSVVSDVSPGSSPKQVDPRAAHLADLPYDEALAIDAMDYTCDGDSD